MTSKYTASLTRTLANVESTYNTAPASYLWFGKTQNWDIQESKVTQLNRTQDLSREVSAIDVIQKTFQGPVMWRVQDGSFFLAAFGTLQTTGTGPWTHTFTTGDDLVSYSVYHEKKGRGAVSDLIEETTGCKTNEFKLTCTEGGYLEAENAVIGKDRATVAQKSATSLTTTPFRFTDISGGKVTVNAVDLKITNYEYTRNNNLSTEQEDDTISEPCPQELTENLNLGFKLSGTAARSPFKSGTEVPVVIVWTRGSETLTITHQVVFNDHPEPTGVEGEIDVSAVAEVRSTTAVLVDSVNSTYTF